MKITSALILAFFAVVTGTNAQTLSPELVEASRRIQVAFDQNLKGWTRKNIFSRGSLAKTF